MGKAGGSDMTATPITPCSSARDYATCQLCRRAHPTHEDRAAMLRCWSASWTPTAYGQCDGLLPRGDKP